MSTVQSKPASLGRPRKSSEDVNSGCERPPSHNVQRRRAQVREAQKAYRSRQQSQISSLKARVKQLEDGFEILSRTMHVFNDQVIQNGSEWPQPRLFRAVQRLCDDIASQFQCAHIQSTRFSKPQKIQQPQTEEKAQTQVTPTSFLGTRNDRSSHFWSLFMSSSSGMMPVNMNMSQNSTTELSSIPLSHTPILDTTVIQYATTPFSQRLFRACAESGLRFLSNLSFKAADMWPEFGMLLQKMPREEIRDYFTRVVTSQPCNPVIDARFPFISLGGSGTHFLTSLDNASGVLQRFEHTNGVLHVASEEQWFDVHDVERYLFSQGIAVGEFPSSTPSVQENIHGDAPSTLGIIQDVSSSSMMMVVDEYKLVNRLSQLPVGLGCVAGFRRSDVERVVSQNARWINVNGPG